MRNLAPRSLTVALMLLALAACSTDTPTAPEANPAPPPGTAPSTAWNITVTVEPRDLTASDAQPATVTVRVRRASDGALPQNGTTVVVSAGLGEFISAGSGEQTVVVALGGGGAQLLYFAGAILGQDTISAQLEGSIGSARINIIEIPELFIQSVNPTSGPDSGGTRIRISGQGFSEPARVELIGKVTINATVDRVGKDSDGEFIRAFTGQVLNPDTFFDTETCDSDGDGTLDGSVYIPTSVDVKAIFTGGAEAQLDNAFTYQPRDRSCRPATPAPDKPRADFSFIVDGYKVQFFNESTPAGLTYIWSFGDGTNFSTSESPSHNYTNACTTGPDAPGPCEYNVTLVVENASGSDSKTRKVTVDDPNAP